MQLNLSLFNYTVLTLDKFTPYKYCINNIHIEYVTFYVYLEKTFENSLLFIV